MAEQLYDRGDKQSQLLAITLQEAQVQLDANRGDSAATFELRCGLEESLNSCLTYEGFSVAVSGLARIESANGEDLGVQHVDYAEGVLIGIVIKDFGTVGLHDWKPCFAVMNDAESVEDELAGAKYYLDAYSAGIVLIDEIYDIYKGTTFLP